jgi:methylated-DNA-protein-cysteine methyltransferase related protein
LAGFAPLREFVRFRVRVLRKGSLRVTKRTKKKSPKHRAHTGPATNAKAILAAVKRIPRGRVSTYGGVAEVAGLPRRARLVGTVLRQTPASRGLPWFRVINASGRISFPVGSDAYARQRKKLEAEGVVFSGGRVDLTKYGWPESVASLDEYLWKVG